MFFSSVGICICVVHAGGKCMVCSCNVNVSCVFGVVNV